MTNHQDVWNDERNERFFPDSETRDAIVLDQYKLFVEMADRISGRRATANTFFLTLNSAVFTLVGVFWEHRPQGEAWMLRFPTIALVGQCAVWYGVIRSYRKLNSAKWRIVGAIEARLPIAPYRTEWNILGDAPTFWRFTTVERLVPVLFSLAYIGGFLAAVLSGG